MKSRVIVATSVLFLTTLLIANGNMNINIVNGTEKTLQFVVSEPDGSTSTGSYSIEPHAKYNLDLDSTLSKGCDTHGLCHKSKLWVVLSKWGDGVVYLRCPRMYNPKGSTTSLNLEVNGDDPSELTCQYKAPEPKPKKAS